MKPLNHYSSLIFGSLFALLSCMVIFAGEHLVEGEQAVVTIYATQQAGSENQLDQDIDDNDSEQIRNLLSQAQTLSAQQQKTSALQRYEQVLILNPTHQLAAINKAILMKSEMGCELADSAITHAIANNRGPRLAKALSLHASCLLEQQQPQQALIALQKAIEYFPNHPLLWKKLARAQRSSNSDANKVVITFKRALALAPSDQNLRLELAEFQQQQLDFRGSINTLKSAYRQLRRDYQGQYLLAWNYLELNMRNNARKHIRLAGRLNKSKRILLDAMQLYVDKKYDASIALLKQNLRRQRSGRYLLALNYIAKSWPNNAQRFLTLVADKPDYRARAELQNWYLSEQKEESKQRLDRIRMMHERYLSASYLNELAAQLLLSEQQADRAVQWLKTLNFPSRSAALNTLYIEALWATGDKPAVFALLESLQKSDSSDPRILRLHANYLQLDQKPLAALKKMQSMPVSDLEQQDFHNMADLALLLKETTMAIRILQEATDTFPESTTTRLRLAQAHFHNQSTLLSRKQLDLLLKLDPKNPAGLKFLSENF